MDFCVWNQVCIKMGNSTHLHASYQKNLNFQMQSDINSNLLPSVNNCFWVLQSLSSWSFIKIAVKLNFCLRNQFYLKMTNFTNLHASLYLLIKMLFTVWKIICSYCAIKAFDQSVIKKRWKNPVFFKNNLWKYNNVQTSRIVNPFCLDNILDHKNEIYTRGI